MTIYSKKFKSLKRNIFLIGIEDALSFVTSIFSLIGMLCLVMYTVSSKYRLGNST